jgi:hypothetical protein
VKYSNGENGSSEIPGSSPQDTKLLQKGSCILFLNIQEFPSLDDLDSNILLHYEIGMGF